MKKLLAILLALTMVLGANLTAFAVPAVAEGTDNAAFAELEAAYENYANLQATNEASFVFGNSAAQRGEEVRVSIDFSSTIAINSIGVRDFVYDTSLFELVGIEQGDLASSALFKIFDVDKQAINIGYMSNEVRTGRIAQVVFKIKEDAPLGTYPISAAPIVKSGPTEYVAELTEGSITVKITPTDVVLNKNELDLVLGTSETLTATVLPENATNKNVEWASSDPSIVSVSEDGTVKALAAGSATIFARAEDSDAYNTCYDTCTVNVVIPVERVELDKDEILIAPGSEDILTATVYPDNATNPAISWSSSEESVATVDNGVVKAINPGTTVITVTTADGGYSDSCVVTVSVPVEGVTLNKAATVIAVNKSEKLVATITPADATNKNVKWVSNNEAVATVSAAGVVTAKKAGTATITVTTEDGGFTDTCEVTVVVPVTGVTLNKSATTINVGATETLVATIIPSNATNQNVTWSSDDEDVAVVSGGIVTAKKAGTATITVKTDDGDWTASCTVTVVVPVESVTLNKVNAEVYVGESTALTATVLPTNATNKAVTWASENPAIAKVEDGVVTGVSFGTTRVTATTVDGNKVATCTVNVILHVESVTLNKTELSLAAGESETLIATVNPANAHNKTLLWKSTDETVAIVSNDGVVTAVAEGTAVISATSQDRGITATCNLTVTGVVNPDVTFNIESVNAPKNSEVYLTLSIENNAGKALNTIGLRDLVYDANALEFVGIANPAQIFDDAFLKEFDRNLNTLSLGFLDVRAYNGDIIDLRFKVKPDAPVGEYTIDATSIVKNGHEVITSDINVGKINVFDNIPGDVNLDGYVDIYDAIYLFQHTMMPDLYPIYYLDSLDFDCDGNVEIADAILLFQHSMMGDLYKLYPDRVIINEYAVTYKIVDASGVEYTFYNLKVFNEAGEEIESGTSNLRHYLVDGNYSVKAFRGEMEVAETAFVIEGANKEVVITMPTYQGVLTGYVADATDRTSYISDAKVEIRTRDGVLAETLYSDAEGKYEISLDAGEYTLHISKDGYIPFESNTVVRDNDITYVETLLMVVEDPDPTVTGNAGGTITNSVTGYSVIGASINVREGWNKTTGNVVATGVTGERGVYKLNLPLGNYTLELSKEGYITTYLNIIVTRVDRLDQNASMNPVDDPVIPEGDLRIVLEWGATPSDLDSHLVGPSADGTGKFHTYYANRNYSSNGTRYADLDKDDVTSYGPETTTIYQMNDTGKYTYMVHNFSNRSSSESKSLSNSGAFVKVYAGDVHLGTFNVPTNKVGTVWTVFEYDAATGRITGINTMSNQSNPSSVGDTAALFDGEMTPEEMVFEAVANAKK